MSNMRINGIEFKEERSGVGPHQRLHLLADRPLVLEDWLSEDLEKVVEFVNEGIDLAVYPIQKSVTRGKPVIPNIAPEWHWDESYEPRGDHHVVRVLVNHFSENGRGTTDLVLHADFLKEILRKDFLERVLTGFSAREEILELCRSGNAAKERAGISRIYGTQKKPAWKKVDSALKRKKAIRKFNWGENPDTAYLFANRLVVHRSGATPVGQRDLTPQNLRGWNITQTPAGLVLN
jgi:hypothetical protein